MSEDPKGFDAGDYNLFRYCGNDPEDRTDPMGLQTIGDAAERAAMAQRSYMQSLSAADRFHIGELAGETSLAGNAAASMVNAYNNGSGSGSSAWSNGGNHFFGLTYGTKKSDSRLARFNIPEAIGKVANLANDFTKKNPGFNGRAIAGALSDAQADGRIVIGERKSDFRGKDNTFTTYNDIIHVNPDSHPRPSLIPALLAHEGQHLIDPVHDGRIDREFRGFQVEHGFADIMHVQDLNARTRGDIARLYPNP